MNKAYKLIVILLCIGSMVSYGQEYRSYSGFGNNPNNLEWGSAGHFLANECSVAFGDGISTPAGMDRGNPREISNLMSAQDGTINDQLGLSDFVWAFGQFVDHDITFVKDFSPATHPEEALFIKAPLDDQYFAPNSVIPMMRSKAAEGTGLSVDNYRKYENEISSFIDGSAVYGSDEERAHYLRTFEDGKLKTSGNGYLPWNTKDGEFNSSTDPESPAMDNPIGLTKKLYIAGDERANENPLLTSIHTLFVREHNRICDLLIEENPSWNDERIYQQARKIVGGMIQHIVYEEWLPSIGITLPPYSGYNENIDPSIFNVFSAAAFRMGHTLINSNLIRMKNDGDIMSSGNIGLRDAYFNPLCINLVGGIEPYLKGMATQIQQDFDAKVIDDLRCFLFGSPEHGGLDLAAININRGRDRGLPDYNTIREDFGLPKVKTFHAICADDEVSTLLQEIYGNVDNIDPWIGMLSEDHLDNKIFGELVTAILTRQFRFLRDGDRFFYENDKDITPEQLDWIKSTRLTDVVMRNTNIDLMQDEVFVAMDHSDINNGPSVVHTDLNTTIYPNPVIEAIHALTWSERELTASYVLINNRGDIVQSGNMDLKEGKNSVDIALDAQYPAGIYHLKISAGENYFLNRILIQN